MYFTLQPFFFLFLYFFFGLYRPALAAYGSSQARGRIRAAAASLFHSNAAFEPHLPPILQLTATLDP